MWGPLPPLLFLVFQRLCFCFENRFIKCSLILSPKMLTFLYFLSQIRPQCCMLQVLKSEVFIQVGKGRGGTRPPLSEFSGSAPGDLFRLTIDSFSSENISKNSADVITYDRTAAWPDFCIAQFTDVCKAYSISSRKSGEV